MRIVIVGPGAIGGVIGGRLFRAHHEVVLVARSEHLEAIRSKGLTLSSPEGSVVLPIPTFGDPAEAELRSGDVVVIATKSQDTVSVLDAITAGLPENVASDQIAVACAQNGVNNEREALRRFPHVYGICVMLPGAHMEPGVVEAYSSPTPGILDNGRYPGGTDATSDSITSAFRDAGFVSLARPDIMRWKYRKLMMNLFNAVEALFAEGRRGWPSELTERLLEEANQVFEAAGIDVASAEEDRERRGDILRIAPVSDRTRGGGSSWQSLARGLGSIESDYLNGEIVLLGRLYGIETPVNALLQRLAGEAARSKTPPQSLQAQDFVDQLG